jgi:hypothetical protein
MSLLVVLVSLVVDDVEELELVDATRGGDDAEPVTELLLLEELLGQVLEVAAGQVVVGSDLDLALAGLADDNVVAKVVGAAVNLDAVLEELLEGGDVEDLVAGRLRSVDDELLRLLLLLLLLYHEERLSLLYFSPDSPSPPAAAARTDGEGEQGRLQQSARQVHTVGAIVSGGGRCCLGGLFCELKNAKR